MRGVGIADVLRQMRKVDVLVGEMQQMPRPLPGTERAEGNAGLFLEQVQEARRGQSSLGGTARRRHRFAAESTDLQNRARHAGIEFAPRQRFTKTQGIEFGAGELVAGVMFAQFAISGADAAGESFAFRPREAFGELFQHPGGNALRLDHDAEHRTMVAGDGVPDVREHGDHLAIALAAIGSREPESTFYRGVDVERTRTALARAAEQPCVKNTLRGDQHQMAGFLADVVHGSSSSRGSLAAAMGATIAEIWGLTTAESVIPGRPQDEPGISRFRVRCFASPRNDGARSGADPWRHILLDAGLAF